MNTTKAVNINISDVEVRTSLARILDQSATSTDVDQVRTYLRTSDEGRAVALSTIRSATSERVLQSALAMNPNARERPVLFEIYSARADVMLDDLLRDCATAAERLVAQQIVDAWTRLEFVQNRYDEALLSEGADAKRFWDKMLSRAAQRYLRALETLSRIRRYEVQVVDRLDADGSQQRSVELRASS